MELEGQFDKKYLFSLNFIQGLILLSFNKKTSNSLGNLIESTGVSNEKELRNFLNPLIYSKILIKNDSDIFVLNSNFNFNSKKVKVLSVPKNEDFCRKEKIEDDRAWVIEAVIIRILKKEKKLHHNELIRQVIEQMEMFKIQIQVIINKNRQ